MLAWLWKRLSEGGAQVSISGRALRRFPEPEIGRLLRARVLIEERKADNWSLCPHCDCGLDARPIRQVGDALFACCPNDAAEDLILSAEDIRRFSIDSDRLAERIAASGDLGGGVARVAGGLWLLGDTPSGHAVLLCAGPEDLVAPGVILAIRSAASQKPIAVIACEFGAATAIRLREAGIETRLLSEALQSTADGQERLIFDAVPASVDAPRLVLNVAAQSAILDGRRLELPMQMFALFRLLAEQAVKRDPVLKKQTIEVQTGRPANEIIRDLRRSLAACGLSGVQTTALVNTMRARGYRLGLDASEVKLEG